MNVRTAGAAALALLMSGVAAARTPAETFAPFAELLDRHVVVAEKAGGGRVTAFDYAAALEAPDTDALLARQDRLLAAFDPARLDARGPALAFWINAYNHFMIAHVLRQARRSGELAGSVKDFGTLIDPFAVFKRELFNVGGRRLSLDDIEKSILLGERYRQRGWFDARVHFAVNCASVGCPPLRPKPYSAGSIDAELDDNTRRTLASPLHLRIQGDTIHISSLFDWYRADFTVAHDSPRAFIAAHISPRRAGALRRAGQTELIDYDWRLNRPDHFEALARRSPPRP